MNHYCVILLTVFAIVAYTSAAATETAPSNGNGFSGVMTSAQQLRVAVVKLVEACLNLVRSIIQATGGMGNIFLQPINSGLGNFLKFLLRQ